MAEEAAKPRALKERTASGDTGRRGSMARGRKLSEYARACDGKRCWAPPPAPLRCATTRRTLTQDAALPRAVMQSTSSVAQALKAACASADAKSSEATSPSSRQHHNGYCKSNESWDGVAKVRSRGAFSARGARC